MNTMADGAAQRLVAQIGEALFGQPGLTLMELAEKVKATQATPSSRWAANGEPDPHGNRYDCERAALAMGNLTDDELANEVFIKGDRNLTFAEMTAGELPASAYLLAAKDRIRWLSRALVEAQPKSAAQPSPAGQGDVRAQFDAWLKENGYNRDKFSSGRYIGDGVQIAWEAVQALAARQPVGATGKHSLTVGGGQAVAWMTHHDQPMLYPTFSEAAAYCDDDEPPIPLYAALPAQAVDLGKLRELASEMDRFRTKWNTVSIAEFNHYADRLQALIDSKASAGEPNTAPNRLTDPAPPTLFYIQDTRQVVGNCPVWWGPNGGGYVTRLDEAGRYTEQEAVSQNRTRDTDIPWPCAEIDALARETVDCQHMRPRAERLAELSMLHGQAVQP